MFPATSVRAQSSSLATSSNINSSMIALSVLCVAHKKTQKEKAPSEAAFFPIAAENFLHLTSTSK